MKTEIKMCMSWPKYQTWPRDITQTQAQSNLLFSSLQRSFWYVCIMLHCVTQTQWSIRLSHSSPTNAGCAAWREPGSVFGIKLPYNAQLPSWGPSLRQTLLTVPQMEVLSIWRLVFVWANELRSLVNKQQLSWWGNKSLRRWLPPFPGKLPSVCSLGSIHWS